MRGSARANAEPGPRMLPCYRNKCKLRARTVGPRFPIPPLAGPPGVVPRGWAGNPQRGSSREKNRGLLVANSRGPRKFGPWLAQERELARRAGPAPQTNEPRARRAREILESRIIYCIDRSSWRHAAARAVLPQCPLRWPDREAGDHREAAGRPHQTAFGNFRNFREFSRRLGEFPPGPRGHNWRHFAHPVICT